MDNTIKTILIELEAPDYFNCLNLIQECIEMARGEQ